VEERLLNGCLFVCEFRLALLAADVFKSRPGGCVVILGEIVNDGQGATVLHISWQNLTGQRMTCAWWLTVYSAVDKK